MGLIDKLKELFKKEPEPEKAPEAPEKAARQKTTALSPTRMNLRKLRLQLSRNGCCNIVAF